MEVLKHPVGIGGACIMVGALIWINTGGLSGGSATTGRETQADGYAWTAYCEELRQEYFEFDDEGNIRPIHYAGRIYPRHQESFDKMVAADCDPRKAPRNTFPGISQGPG